MKLSMEEKREKLLDRLSSVAKEIVEREKIGNPDIIAAYSDGSLARGDVVRGSDVDIGFIIKGSERKDEVIQRELKDGVVFEWGFFPQTYYEDIDEVLADAGFTHDVASAKIWYDPDNFLGQIQQTVRERCKSKNSIKARAEGQIKVVRDSYDKYKATLEDDNNRDLIQPLISISRSLFAVPTAVLNKPVTNTRACLYCRRDAQELSIPEYPDSVLNVLGIRGISREKVEELLDVAYKVYDESNFPQDRIDTFKAHLEIVDYLLEADNPEAAAWPLLFWSMAWIRDLDKNKDREVIDRLFEVSLPIREEFGLVKTEDLKEKQKFIEQATRQAEAIIADKFD